MTDTMMELKEMLCEELDKIVDKGTISMSDLEIVHKLVDTIKNIHKIDMYDDGGYSGNGDWSANGSYNNGFYNNSGRSYGRDYQGNSRGRHYVRGHYSYDDGMVTERIERMMSEGGLNPQEKDTLRRAMEILKK